MWYALFPVQHMIFMSNILCSTLFPNTFNLGSLQATANCSRIYSIMHYIFHKGKAYYLAEKDILSVGM
jgi:hypothetical protein